MKITYVPYFLLYLQNVTLYIIYIYIFKCNRLINKIKNNDFKSG